VLSLCDCNFWPWMKPFALQSLTVSPLSIPDCLRDIQGMCNVLGSCSSYVIRTHSKRSGEMVMWYDVRGRCVDEPDIMMKSVKTCKVCRDMQMSLPVKSISAISTKVSFVRKGFLKWFVEKGTG
jgi:hypothetical protein